MGPPSAREILFTTSTVGICPVEEIQSATRRPFWFQLYMMRDRDFVLEMLKRAQVAGCQTLVFTVDLAVAGMRLRDYRNGMLGGGWQGKKVAVAATGHEPAVGVRCRPQRQAPQFRQHQPQGGQPQ